MILTSALKWHPLDVFKERFGANVAALAGRDPLLAERLKQVKPARPYSIASEANTVYLGRPGLAGIEMIANPIPPSTALDMSAKLCPRGVLQWPLVIGGLGYGWLWDRMTKLPCKVDAAPGHRPPIYLVTGDIERLWVVLHVMDWRQLLGDARFPIFAGPDAVEQLQRALIDNPMLPRPRLCVRVEQTIWQHDFTAMLLTVSEVHERRLGELRQKLDAFYRQGSAPELSQKFHERPLRVLGLTSRYTTFLQHSMRDWLDGFDQLGHQTRLFIEPADHLMPGPLDYAGVIGDFCPDLILSIDHHRSAVGHVAPQAPFVMWVQDRLPKIFNAQAGAEQGPRDYCLGFGRLHLAERYGYPRQRFMPSTIGINDRKYAARKLSPEEQNKFGCEVSYVSHASVPADTLIRNRLAEIKGPGFPRLFWDLHERMTAHFESGGQSMAEPVLARHVAESSRLTRVDLSASDTRAVLEFFGQKVNSAIFRQQALLWVAEAGVDLRLYGRGWENHPKLARFARGEADNLRDLPAIYLASKLNLQLIPHGVMHQRLLDGLAAGGFFLMRYTPGDAMGIPYRKLWKWCGQNNIQSDAQMRAKADARANALIAEIDALYDYNTVGGELKLYDCLATCAEEDFATLASAVWPTIYPQVSFNGPGDLRAKMARYLGDKDARQKIALEMRQAVVARCSYREISQRLIKFIAADLSSQTPDAAPEKKVA